MVGVVPWANCSVSMLLRRSGIAIPVQSVKGSNPRSLRVVWVIAAKTGLVVAACGDVGVVSSIGGRRGG